MSVGPPVQETWAVVSVQEPERFVGEVGGGVEGAVGGGTGHASYITGHSAEKIPVRLQFL